MKIKGYLTVFGGFWNYVLGFGFFRAYAVILNPMMVFYAKGDEILQGNFGLLAVNYKLIKWYSVSLSINMIRIRAFSVQKPLST